MFTQSEYIFLRPTEVHKKKVPKLAPFLHIIYKPYFGRLNARVISAICSSVIPSGVKPIDLAAT